MRIVTIDIESFFSDAFTLKKLTTEEYIRSPQFEVHGAGIKWGPDTHARWYDARQLKQVLADEDWSATAILCHHAQFDGLILSHCYGIRPRLWLDTLSMARLCLGNHLSVSLDNVRLHFGIPAKRTPYERFKGRRWHDLDDATRRELVNGCCDEVESIYAIFNRLAKTFPREEYEIVDLTIRMFTEPVLRADTQLLAKLWEQEEHDKAARTVALDVDAGDLASANKFVALLAAEGVDTVYKSGKNGPIPALAKTDEFMRELLEDDNPRIRGLAEARLGAKSTLLQSRAETIGYMAQRGPLAVYLRYCGAHTTRWSGGDSSNFQNFKRGSELRRAILAPEGYLLATVDLSQIECRLLNYLAGQTDVIERFRRGEDPYVGIASEFYGRPITKADAAERGTGKQAELSCGYGCGANRFQGVARLGIYGPPVILSGQDSQRAVDLYRATHARVVALWNEAGNLLSWLAGKLDRPFLSCMRVADGKLFLPNGAWINYETLEWHVDTESGDAKSGGYEAGWRMKTRHGWTRMYGAKLVENFVQALARVIMSQAGARIARAGFRPVLSSHDEWSFLVLWDGERYVEYDAENKPHYIGKKTAPTLQFIMQEMKREPEWLPGIPIDCEGGLSERYDK